MNLVAIIGNVATDPELRYTPSGRAVCTFRVAVDRANGAGDADFFSVVVWERQAEVCNDYCHRGRRVAIEGRLHHSTWEAEEGRRSRVEIVGHRVKLLGSRRADPAAAASQPEEEFASAETPAEAALSAAG